MRKEIMYMIAYPDGTLVMNTQKVLPKRLCQILAGRNWFNMETDV